MPQLRGQDPLAGPGQRPGWLGRTLAANAGYVDAAGYVGLVRLFTAHQSGNTVGLGAALGTGSWSDVWKRGVALLAFTLGVAAGTALVEINNRNRPTRSAATLAAAELLLLALALAVGEAESTGGVLRSGRPGPYIVAAVALAGAMGVQTVSLRRIGNRSIRTTFITGVMTNLAENFVAAWYQPTAGRRRKMLDFSGILTSVWVMYLAGAVAGAALETRWSFAALGVAMAVTAFIAVHDIRAPYRPDLPATTHMSE